MSDVTGMLTAVERGEPGAAEELLPLVYDELRRVAAAEAMRRILVENARRKQRLRHGGHLERVDVAEVQLCFFAGLTQAEAAKQLGVSVATAALFLVHLHGTAANLIQNGSFEDPVVGRYGLFTTGQTIGGVWQVESAVTYVDVIGTYGTQPPSTFYPTPAGDQFCYLGDNVSSAVLRQDTALPLVLGVPYDLAFLQSSFYQGYRFLGGELTVELTPAGGPAELTRLFSLSGYADWTEPSLEFQPAASGPYTLRLSSTSGVPGNMDDVRLVEATAVVPEPAACGVAFGPGLLGEAGWRRCGTVALPLSPSHGPSNDS